MEAMVLNVQKLFFDEFVKVTEQLSQITMQSSFIYNKKQDDLTGIVRIKENIYYDLALVCSISYPVAQQIVKGMSRGMVSTKEETIIYMTEYLNIATGRAVSHINNFYGKSIRFSVPEINKIHCEKRDEEKDMDKYKIYFQSDFGNMMLEVAYKSKDVKYL